MSREDPLVGDGGSPGVVTGACSEGIMHAVLDCKRDEGNDKRDGGAALRSTVFVLDDHAVVRDSLQWLVEANGIAVQTYASASEFFADYDLRRPGCLLIDVSMPGMGCLALLDELRARGIRLPVILMSGSRDPDVAVQAARYGVLDFLEKPFTDTLLLQRVRRGLALDKRRRRSASARRPKGKLTRRR